MYLRLKQNPLKNSFSFSCLFIFLQDFKGPHVLYRAKYSKYVLLYFLQEQGWEILFYRNMLTPKIRFYRANICFIVIYSSIYSSNIVSHDYFGPSLVQMTDVLASIKLLKSFYSTPRHSYTFTVLDLSVFFFLNS